MNVCPPDFAIEAAGKIYQCHLFLVVDFSKYVRKLVSADPCLRSISVPITGTSEEFFAIITYIYSNQIDITMENFKFIRECALFFESSKLIQLTSDYLARSLTIDNVLTYLDPEQSLEANQFVFDFIAQNFMQLIQDPKLLELPYNFYPSILGHRDLVYDDEEVLFKFIENLVKKNKNFYKLFSYVDFNLISGECVSNFFKLVHVENITGSLWYAIRQRLYCNQLESNQEAGNNQYQAQQQQQQQQQQQVPLQPQQLAHQQVQQNMFDLGTGFSQILPNMGGWGFAPQPPMFDGMNSWGKQPGMMEQNPQNMWGQWNMQQPWGMPSPMMDNGGNWGFASPIISQQPQNMQNSFQQPAPEPIYLPHNDSGEESNEDAYEYEQESSKEYSQPQQQQQQTSQEQSNPSSQPAPKPSFGFHPQKSVDTSYNQQISELFNHENQAKQEHTPTIIPSQKLSKEDFPSFASYSNPPSTSSISSTKSKQQNSTSQQQQQTQQTHTPKASPWSTIPSQKLSFDQIAKMEEEKAKQSKIEQEQIQIQNTTTENDDSYQENEKQRIMSLIPPFTENYPIGSDDKSLLIQGIFYRIFNILDNSPVKEGVITMNCGGTNQKSLLNLVDYRTKLYWTNSTELSPTNTVFNQQDMWFTITFPYHKVKVTSYTFCCYIDFTNSFTPRSWKFYGSNDSKNWTLISEEKNVRDMKSVDPIVNFSVLRANQQFYSSFKFECTQNWSRNYPGKFFLSKLEFFGKVEYK